MAFCSNCGTKHPAEANFCNGCGTKIYRPDDTAPSVPAADGSIPEGAATEAQAPELAGIDRGQSGPDRQLLAVQGQAEAVHATVAHAQTAEQAWTPDRPQSAKAARAPEPVLTTHAAPQGFRAPENSAPPLAPYAAQPFRPAPGQGPGPGAWQPPMASPVQPMTGPPPPMPPVPQLAPGVASAPRPASSMPDIAGMVSSLKIPGVPEGEDGRVIRFAVVGVGALVAVVLGFAVLSKIVGALMRGEGILGFIVILFLAAFALAGFFAFRAHGQETREARTIASLPPSVQHVVAQMDGGAQSAFFNEYERFKKRTSISYLLWWLCGAHYFYLRQPMLNVAYWVTAAGAGWWGLFDFFRMRSLVGAANEQSARQALQTLHIGAAFAQMPVAPGLMVQPVPPAPAVYPAPGPAHHDR